MMDLSEQEPLTGMVDKLAQLVITGITILGGEGEKNMSSLSWAGANTRFL